MAMIPQIRLVQIKNYKSLASLSVKLEPFTVFVGPNGSGKSNFIDALAFVQECLSETLDLAVNRRAGMGAILNRLEDPQYVHIPPYHLSDHDKKERFAKSLDAATTVGFRFILDLGENRKADYSMDLAMMEWGAFFVARERCVVENAEGHREQFEVRAGQFVKEIKGIAPFLSYERLALYAAAATETFKPVFDFLYSMRFYAVVPERLRELQDPDLGYFLKRDGSNAAAVLRNLKRYGLRQADAVGRLVQLMSQIAQNISGIDDHQVGTQETLSFTQEIGLAKPQKFAALNMSDGTLRAFGVLLAVYQPNWLSVVGIEEPEATIHPALLEMIMEVLMDAAAERQILVTTHSPEFLDQKALLDSQIRVVEWKNGRTLIAPASPDDRQIIRERLSTPGELLRMNELDPDADEAERAGTDVDLFGEPFPDVGTSP